VRPQCHAGCTKLGEVAEVVSETVLRRWRL